jgi:hypothetical protein
MHRCSPVLRLHDHACRRSTLRDISDSLSVRRSTTSSSIASGLHAHNWSRSVDRCKIKCAAPRRWLETVLSGTPCDTASSSAKLGALVKYRFETPVLSGSPPWTRFELSRRKTAPLEPAQAIADLPLRVEICSPPVQTGHPVWTHLELVGMSPCSLTKGRFRGGITDARTCPRRLCIIMKLSASPRGNLR